MIRSIIKDSLYSNYRISCKRSLQNGFLKSFLYCREVILRNCSANHFFFEYIWRLQISGWLKTHLNMSVLSMSSGLFLILGIYVRFLLNSLTECNLWCLQCDLTFISGSQLACKYFQMLVPHTIQ